MFSRIPKGILIPVGGAEDKGTDLEEGVIIRNRLNFFELGILKKITHLIGDENSRIEVITTASQIPEEVGENYLQAFAKLGYNNVGIIDIRNREDAQNLDYIERVKQCNGLMFTGGNQLRLTAIFGGSEILSILRNRYYNEKFVIGGTSAGAMAMSRTMIYEGNVAVAHLKGEVKITTGLGFVEGTIIDSHFDKRGRFMRLAQAVATNPGTVGIGLGEDTGVIIRDGHLMEIIGSGSVTIIDGFNAGFSNIADIDFNSPISIENLSVHILNMGNGYDIKHRIFQPIAEYITQEQKVSS